MASAAWLQDGGANYCGRFPALSHNHVTRWNSNFTMSALKMINTLTVIKFICRGILETTMLSCYLTLICKK